MYSPENASIINETTGGDNSTANGTNLTSVAPTTAINSAIGVTNSTPITIPVTTGETANNTTLNVTTIINDANKIIEEKDIMIKTTSNYKEVANNASTTVNEIDQALRLIKKVCIEVN